MFWKKRVYVDVAAGVSPNPSSPHAEGRRSREQLEGARRDIARLTEVKPDDVIFTGGATEANALAILGSLRAVRENRISSLQNPASRIHALYLPSAHASIVENMKQAAREGVEVESLPIRSGRVDTEALKKMLRPETVLVSMDAVCGETGIIWNTRAVAQLLRASRGPGEGRVLLHVDASQAPLTEKITRAHFGAGLMVLDASKVGSVRGIGALIASRTIDIEPLYKGGGQERGLSPGSESPELASAFAAVLRAAAENRETFRAASERMRADLTSRILNIPNISINEGRTQAPHILNLSLPRRDTDYLVALLDEEGFAVSTRSACETDSQTGSRSVFALTGDRERARATLRISWGPDVSSRDLDRFARALIKQVAFVDRDSRG